MQKLLILLTVPLLAALVPCRASAQTRPESAFSHGRVNQVTAAIAEDGAPIARRKGDSVWEGVAIGAAAGAVGGFIVVPRLVCGSNDRECSVIVRVVAGLPIFAGGMVAGGLIDKFHVQGPVVWKTRDGVAAAHVGAFPAGGAGVQMTLRLR